jgi:hypothetical protein
MEVEFAAADGSPNHVAAWRMQADPMWKVDNNPTSNEFGVYIIEIASSAYR